MSDIANVEQSEYWNGPEGRHWVDHETRFDAMLIDINLPDADGRDIAQDVRRQYPHVATILTSGAPETIREIGDHVQLLEKPYSVDSLTAAVASAIEHARA